MPETSLSFWILDEADDKNLIRIFKTRSELIDKRVPYLPSKGEEINKRVPCV